MSKPKRAPINTEEQDLLFHLAEAMIAQQETGDASNAILRQEEQGQQSFVNSETLPTRRNDFDVNSVNSQKVLEDAGVKFGEVVTGDSLFQYVELPQEWKKVPTSHSMWSDLVDEKGRKRASIFYKAAFYDREAFYKVISRYSTSVERPPKRYGVTVGQVLDGQTVIHTTEPITGEGKKNYELSNEAQVAAAEWLDEHFPNWRNPSAYWD